MNQLHYVGTMIFAGLLMGTVFDIYNTATSTAKWLRWLRDALDFMFWVGSAAFVYYLTYHTDDGRFRIYTFGLLIIGYFMYRVTLHRYVVGSAMAIIYFVDRLFRVMYRVLYVLIVRPLLFFLRVVRNLLLWVYWVLCMLETQLFKVLYFWIRLLTWPIPKQRLLVTPWVVKSLRWWEGLWMLLSKWIKHNTRDA